jgi:hypothetical protein
MTLNPDTAHAWRQRVRIDAYATLLARVLHYGPDRIDDVLRRHGLTYTEWTEVDESWSSQLSEVMRRQQATTALHFTSTFYRTRRDLAVRHPPLEDIRERLGEARAADAASADAQVQLASFQRPDVGRSEPYTAASPPAAPRGPSAPAYVTPAQAPPPPPPSAPVAAAPPAPAVVRPPPALVETRGVDLQAVIRGLNLPFGGSPPGATGAAAAGSVGAPLGTSTPPQAPGSAPAGVSAPPMPSATPRAAPAAGQETDDISLARYAQIVVDLGAESDKARVLARHDLSEARWSAVAAAWSQRLQGDAALLAEFRARATELRAKR